MEEESALSPEQASIEQSVLDGRITSFGAGPALREDADDTPSLKSEDLYDEEQAEAAMRSDIAKVIDLTEAEVIDLTSDDAGTATRQRRTRARKPERPEVLRNPPLPPQSHIGDDVEEYEGHLVPKCESLVEIQPIPNLWRASFLQVKDVFEGPDGAMLRGLAFTRTRHLRGKLPRYRNELCLILQIDADDDRDDGLQAAVEVPLSHVVGVRKFHYTNTTFPAWRFQERYDTIERIEKEATLTCRWKYRLVYKDAASRRRAKAVPQEFTMSRIRYDEVPSRERFKKADSHLLHEWRGGKVPGGSYDIRENRDIVLPTVLDEGADLATDDDDTAGQGSLVRKQPGQRYSLADMFCGAGGVSYGARAAGLHVKVACDHSKDACNTYRHHFAGTELREADIFSFLAETPASFRVDVLHLSPPCQFWSPAHTVPGVNDEANMAALFSCHHLLGLLKPRVFTLEQTYGILHPRFEYYFNTLVQGFTRHGYSVRWRIVNFVNFGLPSVRNRLLVIGSCPGEALPPFPAYTHAAEPVPGVTKPYVSILQAVARIPRSRRLSDPMHDIAMAKDRNQKPTNPHAPLTRTITCNGGYGNAHWTGQRDFTKREYATLNGFPVRYRFFGSHPKRQIGNVFPPIVTHTLFKHIRAWLERADGVGPVEDEEMPLGDPCDRDEVVLTPEQWASIEYDWDEAVPGSSTATAAGEGNAPIVVDDDPAGGPAISVPCIDWQQADQDDEKKPVLQWTLGTSDAPLDIDAGGSLAEAIELD